MSFILPVITSIRDAADHPCLKADEALQIAQALAADPTQPFLFNTNCGHRGQLMIGRLVENGFPLDLIYSHS